VLRRLAINDERFAEGCVAGGGVGSGALDPKTLALVRLAALVGRWRGTVRPSRGRLLGVVTEGWPVGCTSPPWSGATAAATC
jgi:hypothetical protein